MHRRGGSQCCIVCNPITYLYDLTILFPLRISPRKQFGMFSILSKSFDRTRWMGLKVPWMLHIRSVGPNISGKYVSMYIMNMRGVRVGTDHAQCTGERNHLFTYWRTFFPKCRALHCAHSCQEIPWTVAVRALSTFLPSVGMLLLSMAVFLHRSLCRVHESTCPSSSERMDRWYPQQC